MFEFKRFFSVLFSYLFSVFFQRESEGPLCRIFVKIWVIGWGSDLEKKSSNLDLHTDRNEENEYMSCAFYGDCLTTSIIVYFLPIQASRACAPTW